MELEYWINNILLLYHKYCTVVMKQSKNNANLLVIVNVFMHFHHFIVLFSYKTTKLGYYAKNLQTCEKRIYIKKQWLVLLLEKLVSRYNTICTEYIVLKYFFCLWNVFFRDTQLSTGNENRLQRTNSHFQCHILRRGSSS